MDKMATGTKLAVWKLPCKSWNCPTCRKKKARDLSNRAQIYFEKERLRFWTLTIKPQSSLTEALKHINKSWNRLRLKVTRKYGKVKYFKVLEHQNKSEMPHFHFLCNKYINWHWMKGAAQAAGFGSHLFVADVSSPKVYNYVIKYLRKGMHNDNFLEALLQNNGRRFGFSRGCLPISRLNNYSIQYFLQNLTMDTCDLFLNLNWWNIKDKQGFYPVQSNEEYTEYFFPNKDVLLLAPPASSQSKSGTLLPAPAVLRPQGLAA